MEEFMIPEKTLVGLLNQFITNKAITVTRVIEGKVMDIIKPTVDDLLNGVVIIRNNGTEKMYNVSFSEDSGEKVYSIKQVDYGEKNDK